MELTVPAIDILAALLATVAAMLVGFVNCRPKVLGSSWMKAVGHTHDAFEPRGLRVTPHTLLDELLVITAIALVIGVRLPAA